jgi:DNA-3-methyladenine glycosylase II
MLLDAKGRTRPPGMSERDAIALSVDPRSTVLRSQHEWPVAQPYRLDLTVSALRRQSTNLVDVLASDGQYIRALFTSHGPVIARVAQSLPEVLTVTVEGDAREHRPTLALVRRMLGVDRDLAEFYRGAAQISWLSPLASRMRGVRPPRYPTLWEACVNAIVFQQISLLAASAIMRRLIVALGPPLNREGAAFYTFPTVEQFLGVEDDVLRAAGLSLGKRSTLRRVAEALEAGTLNEGMLETRATPDAAALLRGIKGIGPWTATVILLRGLGRLDVFPLNDTSVARNLALVSNLDAIDIDDALRALSPQQGMLYYHLLLARLEARNDLGRASDSFPLS